MDIFHRWQVTLELSRSPWRRRKIVLMRTWRRKRALALYKELEAEGFYVWWGKDWR